MRAMSMSHQARASLGPKLNESGSSGKINLVPVGTSKTSSSGTRLFPGAPNPCKSTTTGPLPPPVAICATGKAKSETSELSYAHVTSRAVTGLAQVQVLEEGQQSVKRRFDHWLPPYGNKGSLAHGLDVLNDLAGKFDVAIAC